MTRQQWLSACALAVACSTGVSYAAAQETVDQASLGGRVVDQQGGAVRGASVRVRHTETNQVVDAATDDSGRFRFPSLRVGPYDIRVTMTGFAETAHTLTLTVGAAFDVPLTLRIATVDANVSVSAALPVVETARSQIAATVLRDEVDALPLNGRHFLDVALLVPGVVTPNISAAQLFAETSAVPGVGLSVSSQRNFSNNFVVDGLSANDDAAGLSGIPVSVDAVEQLQVITSGGQAALGRALGGFVNVITRSGTNDVRGTAYGFLRDRGLNAANALSGTRLPMTQTQYGVSLGGPLRRDRTFFFLNGEQRRLNQTGLATITPGNAAAVNARLESAGYAGERVATGIFGNPVDTTTWLGKVDHQLHTADALALRLSFYDVASGRSRGAGALNAPSAGAALDNRDAAVAAAYTRVLSPRAVNELRGQFVHGDLAAPPEDPVGPSVSIAGVATFGTSSTSPTGRLNDAVQVVDSVTHQAGAHAIRHGVDVLVNRDTITYPRARRGAYTFASLAAFQSGVYNTSGFTQTFGESVIRQTNPNLGLFLQDEWKAGDAVTLNLGLRYDLQWLETIDTDLDNISPRIGVAWTPTASRRSVVRAGAGLYYDRVPLRALANALLSAGNTADVTQLRQVSISLSPAQTGAPVFPAILSDAVASSVLPNLTTMDPSLDNAYSRQASVEFEQQLGARSTVTAGYQYLRGVHLLMQINQNVPTCVAAGGNNGCRPNPAYANNNQYSASGSSVYHGLHASFVHRPSPWGSLRASYTWSRSNNDVGEAFFSSPIDPTDLSKDWGRSDDDQRHRVVLDGSVILPAHFQVSGVLQGYSALPFNVTSGVTTVQGTAGRPVVEGAFIPRNAGIGSDLFTAGLRVSRTTAVGRVRVETLLEVFNLTNRRNVTGRNSTFGAGLYPAAPLASFNQVTAVGDPRAAQIGIRVRF